MINKVKLMAVAAALLLGTAPAVWAQNGTENNREHQPVRAGASHEGRGNSLTESMKQYGARQNGEHGWVGNRSAGGQAKAGDPGYLTKRFQEYGKASRQVGNERQTGSTTAPHRADNNGGQ